MYEQTSLSVADRANLIAEGIMSFISKFNSSLGVSLLVLGSIGLIPMIFSPVGLVTVLSATCFAFVMGAASASLDVYFKRKQKFRRKQLERKLVQLNNIKSRIKLTCVEQESRQLRKEFDQVKLENNFFRQKLYDTAVIEAIENEASPLNDRGLALKK